MTKDRGITRYFLKTPAETASKSAIVSRQAIQRAKRNPRHDIERRASCSLATKRSEDLHAIELNCIS